MKIPVVDFTAPRDQLSHQIRAGFAACGAVYLSNYGAEADVAKLRAASMKFFALPDEEKQHCHGEDAGHRGYYKFRALSTSRVYGTNGPPDNCSQFYMGDEGTEPNKFPSPEYEKIAKQAFDSLANIARDLTQLTIDAYDQPHDWVQNNFYGGQTLTTMKVMHYPPPTHDEQKGGVRMASHQDITTLTVLCHDHGVPGGVEMNYGGEWVALDPPPNTVTILTGQLLKFLIGDAVSCPKHRVVMPPKELISQSERLSIAMFLIPKPGAMLRTEGKAAISCGDWLQRHLDKLKNE